jgi:DNA repair protein RAD57
MSDIILLPNFATPSTKILEALESAGLHTVDLLTLDVLEIHRRTQLPVVDVQNLVKDVISALSLSIETKTAEERIQNFTFLTTGDEKINALLAGGIPIGSLTEVTGERFSPI